MPTRGYLVNEVFRTIQGEGVRAGTVNVFVRFTGCNLRCSLEPGERSPGGFDCDTEFMSGRRLQLGELVDWIRQEAGACRWVVLTGGEPGLQVDEALLEALHSAEFKVAIETNGSVALPSGIDWITVSPKVAEHAIRQRDAHEVKYVRAYGQALPKTVVSAEHYLISPAFEAQHPSPRNIAWCQQLVLENPQWRMSLQQHKGLVPIR